MASIDLSADLIYPSMAGFQNNFNARSFFASDLFDFRSGVSGCTIHPAGFRREKDPVLSEGRWKLPSNQIQRKVF